MTDTDSLMYEIETEDFYVDIVNDVDKWFDTSDYQKDHLMFSTKNKKVIGNFKDEARGQQIEEYVGVSPKSYSYKMYEDGKEAKKCKGITKAVTTMLCRTKTIKSLCLLEKNR